MKNFISTPNSTIVMAVCFGFSFLGIPLIPGFIILFLKFKYEKRLLEVSGKLETLEAKYESEAKRFAQEQADDFEKLLLKHKEEKDSLVLKQDSLIYSFEQAKKKMDMELASAKRELKEFNTEALAALYSFTDYDGISSEECKNKLSLFKTKEQELIKSDKAVKTGTYGEVSKKMLNNHVKQLLRSFNSECDNILLNISTKNIDASRNKMQKSYETLNKLYEANGIQLTDSLLENKLEQLNLVYTYELKKEQEREEQKAIREQMVEEEKVRREIEREKAKLEKEEAQFKSEISKLMQYLQKTDNDTEKNLYLDKIKELDAKLSLLEKDKENVLQREQNTRAGFVYVISNIGSFGEDVYKIGMTRRLEPMDRINELSSASVPFSFDVHAMIFSEDAPALETTLHRHFQKYEVNKVNHRKEFFKVNLSEIETIVKENHNATVTFTMLAAAKEYRESLNHSA